jgi:hypothetical protein
MVLIYRRLPEDQRQHGVYGKLTGKAMSMLKDGKAVEEVKQLLTKQYVEDKEPLVVVNEPAKNNGPAGKEEPVPGNPQLATNNLVQQSAATPIGQSHVVAVVTRPYFCSTVSG